MTHHSRLATWLFAQRRRLLLVVNAMLGLGFFIHLSVRAPGHVGDVLVLWSALVLTLAVAYVGAVALMVGDDNEQLWEAIAEAMWSTVVGMALVGLSFFSLVL